MYTWMVPSESESELLALVIFAEADLLNEGLLDPLLDDSVLDLEFALDAFSSFSRLSV